MEHTIKFRGKEIDSNKWLYGDLSVNLIPGTTVDTVAFFPLHIDIGRYGVETTFIPNPINDDHYTENLEKCIQESMNKLKEIFDNPLPE